MPCDNENSFAKRLKRVDEILTEETLASIENASVILQDTNDAREIAVTKASEASTSATNVSEKVDYLVAMSSFVFLETSLVDGHLILKFNNSTNVIAGTVDQNGHLLLEIN